MLAQVFLMAGILSSCGGAGISSESNIRQSSVTISETPLFYYKESSSNQYYLALTNNTDQQLSLRDSSITNSSLAESIEFRNIVDTTECSEIAANGNCRLRIKLPYINNDGYFSFTINYQANDGSNIRVSKLIAYSANIPERGGLIYSQQFINSTVVNSDRFTLALPIILDRDYSALELKVGNKSERSTYNKILCDTQDAYNKDSTCTALVELDGHIADPQLSLAAIDANGLVTSYSFVTGVSYNNLPHLVYLNAPVRLGNQGTQAVTVLNIGTRVATNLSTPLVSSLALTTNSQCNNVSLDPNNGKCIIEYSSIAVTADAKLGESYQYVEYSGGA